MRPAIQLLPHSDTRERPHRRFGGASLPTPTSESTTGRLQVRAVITTLRPRDLNLYLELIAVNVLQKNTHHARASASVTSPNAQAPRPSTRAKVKTRLSPPRRSLEARQTRANLAPSLVQVQGLFIPPLFKSNPDRSACPPPTLDARATRPTFGNIPEGAVPTFPKTLFRHARRRQSALLQDALPTPSKTLILHPRRR
ncbi:hypothetical protein K523DRAFT_64631 [Schizophyllum commune Tattone D]|nr:hypothetical protein K523DRAFT_64631 [Schizophyllum commune Tattone D]